jgi:hypothetical protein
MTHGDLEYGIRFHFDRDGKAPALRREQRDRQGGSARPLDRMEDHGGQGFTRRFGIGKRGDRGGDETLGARQQQRRDKVRAVGKIAVRAWSG